MIATSLQTVLLSMLLGAAEEPAWATREDLSYKIALDGESYLPAQMILVTSTMTNSSHRSLRMLQPSAEAFVVTYTLFRVSKEGRENRSERLPVAIPAWSANKETLAHGETSTSTADLTRRVADLRYSGPLPPGRYVLQARYHVATFVLEDDGPAGDDVNAQQKVYSETYRTNVVESNEVEFTIREFNETEKQEWDDFQNLPPDEFLKRYPKSFYRLHAFHKLATKAYSEKDWRASVNYSQRARKEQMATESRDRAISGEASILADKLDDLPAAIQVLRQSDNINNVHHHQALTHRWRKRNPNAPLASALPGEKTPSPSRPLAAAASTADPESGFTVVKWLSATGLIALFVIMAVRSTRRASPSAQRRRRPPKPSE